MTEIVVRETSAAEDGSFGAWVDFGDGGGADVTVTAPVEESAEKLLAWYFEEHLRYPFLDQDLVTRAVGLVREYGHGLFRQVFAGEAAFGYRRVRDRGFEGCRLVVHGSAAFHRLHWEALCDPDTDIRVALRMPLVRRDARVPLHYELPATAPTLNILVVTARPFGSRDVGYRTISQPLLDAIGQAGLPVTVDLVRPGTWEALRDALRAAERDPGRGQGWYQVVHFDVHGGFGTPDVMAGGGAGGRFLFDPAGALADTRQGFLYFETGQAGRARPVAAAQVARALAEHRVSVAVLNACQSAMQTGSEASLAQALVAAGAPVAIGMAYSVTVSAAKQAMPVLYGRLAAGDEPVAAAWEARRSLHDEKTRRGYFEQDLDLEDWILPVVFAQRDSRLALRPMTAAEQEVFFRRREQVGSPPTVEYGFVGRDLDLHGLERLLLAGPDAGQVLVRGMAGAGKSTLLAYAGWWWQRTGLVDQVFAFSYEQRAWTFEQVTRHIAQHLLNPVEFAGWEAMSEAARTGMVTDRLRAQRHLIVVDNAESITASPAAIPHALAEPQRIQLARFLSGLRGGRTLLLVGSREAEDWLAPSTFAGNVYDLPGLDPQAASDLLDRILTRHGGHHWLTDTADEQQRQALTELMRLLDGYPLPMTVVMPQLATTPPAQILAEFGTGQESADPTTAARRAIEYSHGKLDPALQTSILLLAPFTASIPVPVLGPYIEALSDQEAVQALGAVDLTAAVAELQRVGLAAPHPSLSKFVQIVPILPYFLRNRLRDQPGLASAVAHAHYVLNTEISPTLHSMLTATDPQQRLTGRAVVAAEYANLTAALAYAQRADRPVLSIVSGLEEFLDQTQQHDTRRRLLDDAITLHPTTDNPDRQWELAVLHNLAGITALTQHRLDDARRHHEAELAVEQALGRRQEQGRTYHQLAIVAQDERRFEQAEQHYRQALDIYLDFGERHSMANTHHQLGILAQEQRRFEQAEEHYRQALDIYLEFGDRNSAARTYHHLGMVAQDERRYEQAEQLYRQALDVKLEFGDRHSAARAYHQLGWVTQEQGQFEQAEDLYRQALEIKLGFGDRHGAASTYHQLGMVAQDQDQFEQAEQHYRQALEILVEFSDWHSAAIAYYRLGALLSKLNRPHDAVIALLQAEATWHTITGTWLSAVLDELRRVAPQVPDTVFREAITEIIPADLQSSFSNALDESDDN